MNDSVTTKQESFFATFYFALMLALCAVYTWKPLQGGEDFWAHAAVGRWIVSNREIPQQTLWLWSTPPIRWIAHSWFSEVFFYGLMRIGGAQLVLLATLVFVALPFYWAWKLWLSRGGSALFASLFFTLALTCAAVRLQPRPELFTYFFLAILWIFLIGFTSRDTDAKPTSRISLLGVAAMFALWANCHGGVALGLAMIFLTAICEAAQRRSLRAAMPLMVIFFLAALAVNLNPYGVAYWSALSPVGGEMFKMIDEWKSPLVDRALPPFALILVGFVAFIAFLAWAGNRERRWSHLAWLLFFAAFFLMARRNLWPLMLVSVFVAAANAQSLSARALLPTLHFTTGFKFIAKTTVAVIVALWVVSSINTEAINGGARVLLPRAVSPQAPTQLAAYVNSHALPKPTFNDYLRSGFFHWSFDGRRDLYIDLLNAYDAALLRDYFDIIGRTPRGKKLWESLGANTVVFGRFNKDARLAPLANYLDSNPAQWKREYSGPDGRVWVRRIPSG